MKITAYLNRQAPEICYFTLNGIRYIEKPMLAQNVDWYKVMYSKKALHAIAEIRAKHFKQASFVKYAVIELTWPEGFEYLNIKGKQTFTSYKQLIIDLNSWLAKKHPSYFDANMKLLDGSLMPQPKLSIKTKSGFVS